MLSELIIPTEAKKIIEKKVVNPTMQLKYLWIVHFIYELKRLHPKKYNITGKRLNQQKLERILGVKNASALLADLIAWSVIRRYLPYKEGRESFSYVLHPFLNTKRKSYKTYNSTTKQSLLKERNKKRKLTDDQLSKRTFKILSENIRLNQAGLEYLEQKYPSLSTAIDAYILRQPIPIIEVEGIESKDIILIHFLTGTFLSKRPDKENRLHSSFSCLATEFKKYILLDGKPLMAVDISNCSLSLSVWMIENHLRERSGISKEKFIVPDELVRYRMYCESGEIYEKIAEEAKDDLIKYDRSEFKQKFFKQQFFGKKAWGALASAFSRLFPSIAIAIQEIKDKYGYNNFSIRLQKMESQVMLNKVFSQLTGGTKKYKVLTVHDCIYTNDEQVRKEAEQLIKAEFKKKYDLNINTKDSDVEEIQNAIPKIQILPEWFEPYRSKVTIFGKKMIQYKNVYIYLTELRILFEQYPDRAFKITRKQVHQFMQMNSSFIQLPQKVINYINPPGISPEHSTRIVRILEKIQP
jgi:hypothetical protein